MVRKAVEFTLIQDNIYNLAFGDVDENDELNDLTVTNNKDMELVLATVIQTIIVFFETYPDRKVFFTGSSASRTRLYQIVVKKELLVLSQRFLVQGVRNGKLEAINNNKNYDAFLVQVKNKLRI